MGTGGTGGSVFAAIKVDIRRLHDGWMGLIFPRQRLTRHNVLGRWRPQTLSGRIVFWTWYVFGAPIVLLLYPFLLLGFATRYYAHRIDSTATRLGILGVVLVSVIVWGLLTAVALIQLPWEGFIAVAAAGIVATVSAALAFVFSRIGGRGTTVAFAYPFAMNAFFLPPVVAALYSPVVARAIFPGSEQLAIWILDNLLHVYGVNELLRERYTLEGVAYAGMWFGIAVPIGWILGLLVSLADAIRPKQRPRDDGGDGASGDEAMVDG